MQHSKHLLDLTYLESDALNDRVYYFQKPEFLVQKEIWPDLHRTSQYTQFQLVVYLQKIVPISPNLLQRKFNVLQQDKVRVGDITYIWTSEGWLYLAVVVDFYSRRVVGWSINKSMTKQLVMDAILMAIWRRKPAPGLIFHSDRGSQYCSNDFQRILKTNGILSSMSRKDDCWDTQSL